MRLSFGEFVIDFDERRLLSRGQEVRLTPKAFDLLKLLRQRFLINALLEDSPPITILLNWKPAAD